ALVSGLLLSPWSARAEPARFALQSGIWGLGPSAQHALTVDLELRPGVRWWWVRPLGGFLQSTDGTQYVYAGVLLEIPLVWGVTLSPGFAPGICTVGGERGLRPSSGWWKGKLTSARSSSSDPRSSSASPCPSDSGGW